MRCIECKYMKHIFELRMKDQIEERSSQLLRNLSSCEKKAWKKFQAIFLLFDLSSAVQIYVSYIYIHLFILHGYITNSQYDQLPVGLIAQLVEHCTGIAEVMGSNPVQAWNFFQAFFSQLLKLRSNCEDLSSIWWDVLLKTLRVNVSKNQRNRGHGQKIDFAHTLSVWRPR